MLGYPRLMQSGKFWCDGVTGVNHHEADWIDGQVDVLNDAIAAAARAAAAETGADIEFVSVVEQFDNNGACRFWQRDRYVNDLLLDGAAISGASFHPSQKGYDAYFDALAANVVPSGINLSASSSSLADALVEPLEPPCFGDQLVGTQPVGLAVHHRGEHQLVDAIAVDEVLQRRASPRRGSPHTSGPCQPRTISRSIGVNSCRARRLG